MNTAATRAAILDEIRQAITVRQRFVLSSHVRPDGDAIGSQLALAFALEALGKDVRLVNRDPPPPYLVPFEGMDRIEVAEVVEGPFDAAIVLECGTLARTGVSGLDHGLVINIDHHVGNTGYGAINWFDDRAAACGELVAELIDALGVPWTRAIATHIYVAILTDTGGFRHSNITERTFELCRRVAAAGVDAVAVSRLVYDSNGVGYLRLIGALLGGMELVAGNRVAVLTLDHAMLDATGASSHDTEGLINLPLSARDISVVALVRSDDSDGTRVSLRSKGDVNVEVVARQFGGGGHRNAAGFTTPTPLPEVRAALVPLLRGLVETVGDGSHAVRREA
jgi:bifunctional oligoribonuclease and PAP phosphatase NrnA